MVPPTSSTERGSDDPGTARRDFGAAERVGARDTLPARLYRGFYLRLHPPTGFPRAASVTTPTRWPIYRSVVFFAVLSSGAAVAGGLFGKKKPNQPLIQHLL